MYDYIAIITGIMIFGIFLYILVTDGWKIIGYFIKKFFYK